MTCKHTSSTVTSCIRCDMDEYVENLEHDNKRLRKKNKFLRLQLKQTKTNT